MNDLSIAVQVTSFHPGPFGGGALLGRSVAAHTTSIVRALVPAQALTRDPSIGEVWRLIGAFQKHQVFDQRLRREVQAEQFIVTWARPVAPDGEAIRDWIAKHPDIKGVGRGYAERLWDAFGSDLYKILRQRDVMAIARVLDYPKAAAIVDAFGLLLDEITALERLDGLGLDARAARAAVALFGVDAARRFRENPYLLTLLEPWPKVDAAALAAGIKPGDQRRLLAAVDVAAASFYRTTGHNFGGHTMVTRPDLLKRTKQLLRGAAEDCASLAIELAVEHGDLLLIGDRQFQARGPWLMERQIEESISARLTRERTPLDRAAVNAAIAGVEAEAGIRFDPEQCAAVHMALSSGFSAIAGGAGTGKSTIVKAIMRAAQQAQRGDYVQIALSGRAAKRLHEATGHVAHTVYRYLKDLEHRRLTLRTGILVIDECSMVSTPDLWQVLSSTPVEIDVLLVGDTGQLPPIQAGDPSSVLMNSQSIASVSLKVPHRQKEASNLARVAQRVREGNFPVLDAMPTPNAEGVFMLACESHAVPDKVMEAFDLLVDQPRNSTSDVGRLHRADVQVLTMTRRGKAGAVELGDALERRWLERQPLIHNWGLRIGSKILWTKNSYEHAVGLGREQECVDIMNGALGIVRRPTSAGAEVWFDDGSKVEIRQTDLGRIERGWAITTHKAQGSAFRSVIVPIVPSRLLDRAMLYTAITRAKQRVVLVGEPSLLRAAIEKPPNVWGRSQALRIDDAQ